MILIVDDHAESRNVLVRLLKLEGFDAAAAKCAAVALDIMKRRKPSLVLLDCHMPDCDGFMMLERLKAEATLADVPVVMFSAGNDADRERALGLGARAFIRKASVDWTRVLEVVNAFALNQRGGGARDHAHGPSGA